LLGAATFAADDPTVLDATNAARAALAKGPAQPITAEPNAPEQIVMADAATREEYLKSMRAYYNYRLNGYQYRARVFEWQLISSRIIFLIVVLLVFAGIYFAAVQFHVALQTARKQRETGPATPADASNPLSLATQLEISAKGVVLNSSILGVIILVLSLAFFYLYLVYVYPINDVL
jgi:uncharacterized membrane protein